MIKSVTLQLSPATYEVVKHAIAWYHESLHMLVDPDVYEPELPLEQTSRVQRKREIVVSHRLLKEFEELTV